MTLKNWGKAACWRRNVQEVVRPFKILRCGNLPSLCYHLPFNASLAHKSNSSILLFTLLPYLSHKKKKTNKKKANKKMTVPLWSSKHFRWFLLPWLFPLYTDDSSFPRRSCGTISRNRYNSEWLINIKLWFLIASFLLLTL